MRSLAALGWAIVGCASCAVDAPVLSIDDELALAARALRDLVIPRSIRVALQHTDRLMIHPTESIGTIPFALLPLGDDDHTLIDRMTISITPGLWN